MLNVLVQSMKPGLLPFIQERFPDGHRLYQDNDPKHSLKYIEEFFEGTRCELVVHTTGITGSQSNRNSVGITQAVLEKPLQAKEFGTTQGRY